MQPLGTKVYILSPNDSYTFFFWECVLKKNIGTKKIHIGRSKSDWPLRLSKANTEITVKMHFKWRTSNRIKSSRLIPSVEQTLARRVSEDNQHCAINIVLLCKNKQISKWAQRKWNETFPDTQNELWSLAAVTFSQTNFIVPSSPEEVCMHHKHTLTLLSKWRRTAVFCCLYKTNYDSTLTQPPQRNFQPLITYRFATFSSRLRTV